MDMNTRDCIRRIMDEFASQNGMPREELYQCICEQIARGMKSKDPSVRAFWKRIPAEDAWPTPEEAIGYIAAVRLGFIIQ